MLSLLVLLTVGASAAEFPAADPWTLDAADSFNEPHSPLLDGYTIWLMRQNLALDGIQTTLNVESGLGATPSLNAILTTYAPLYVGKRHEFMLGARYALSETSTLDLPVADRQTHTLWVWGAWGIRPSPAWKLVLTTEFFESGTADSFPGKVGNQLMPLFYAAYAFSPQWQVIGMGGASLLWRDQDQKVSPIAGVQLRWIPFRGLRLMAGMPDLFAAEWSAASWLELAGHVWFAGDVDALVRFRGFEEVSFTAQYERVGGRGGSGFSNRHFGPTAAEGAVFNHVTQSRDRVFIEAAWRLSKTTALSCRVGRAFAGDANLLLDDKTMGHLPGRDEWIVGVGINLFAERVASPPAE